MNKCKCGKPAEWADEYCQLCWEAYTSEQWWLAIRGQPNIASSDSILLTESEK